LLFIKNKLKALYQERAEGALSKASGRRFIKSKWKALYQKQVEGAYPPSGLM